MIQFLQFIKWNLRDLAKIIKGGCTVGNALAIAIGYQLGSMIWDIHETGAYQGVLLVTLPITLALIPLWVVITWRWERFKSEQFFLFKTLKKDQ